MALRTKVENPAVLRLRETIAGPRAESLQTSDGLIEERRSQTTANLCNLPAFHPVAVKLLGISTDADSAMADYADAFGADPALAAELLCRANSAEFGHLAYISDIKRALVTMGLERTRSLVFSISMSLYARKAARRADVYPHWSHSMATAILAEHIGAAGRSGFAGLHTAGLMHDIGRLGFLLGEGDRYARILSSKPPGIEALAQLEKTTFGMDHCEGGVLMAARWGFPESLRDCIQFHHAQPGEGADTLLGLVQIACRLADALGFPESPLMQPEDPIETLPPRLRDDPRFAPAVLQDLVTAKLTELWS